MEVIKWSTNKMPKSGDQQLSVMALDEVQRARRFHQSFPQYAVTPLARLSRMAGHLGLKDVFVKDESYRFGLNALKSWAVLLPWPGTSPKSLVNL